MKNIKDITISIFAIIGFVFILSSFTNQSEPQETHSTVPESHVWELKMMDVGEKHYRYIYNKVTGEVREVTKKGYFKIPLQEN